MHLAKISNNIKMDYLTNIGIAYLAYFVGAASPGPSNIAIMQISLEKGRGAGLALGLGVLTASVFWGNLTAFGLVSVWIKYPVLSQLLAVVGGGYFLWLAYGSFVKTMSKKSLLAETSKKINFADEKIKYYLQGFAMHLTNPKAVLVWTSTILLGTQGSSSNLHTPYIVVLGCNVLGIFIFCGHALFFSNKLMRSYYRKVYKPFSLLVAVVFMIAGFILIYKPIMMLIL